MIINYQLYIYGYQKSNGLLDSRFLYGYNTFFVLLLHTFGSVSLSVSEASSLKPIDLRWRYKFNDNISYFRTSVS